jgi:hypothetical protein
MCCVYPEGYNEEGKLGAPSNEEYIREFKKFKNKNKNKKSKKI